MVDILVVILTVLMVLGFFALWFGFNYVLVLLIQYAVHECAGKDLPFWGVFAGVMAIQILFGGPFARVVRSKDS